MKILILSIMSSMRTFCLAVQYKRWKRLRLCDTTQIFDASWRATEEFWNNKNSNYCGS